MIKYTHVMQACSYSAICRDAGRQAYRQKNTPLFATRASAGIAGRERTAVAAAAAMKARKRPPRPAGMRRPRWTIVVPQAYKTLHRKRRRAALKKRWCRAVRLCAGEAVVRALWNLLFRNGSINRQSEIVNVLGNCGWRDRQRQPSAQRQATVG